MKRHAFGIPNRVAFFGVRGSLQAEKYAPEADRQVAGGKLCVKANKQVKKHMSCVFSWESKRENTPRKLIGRM